MGNEEAKWVLFVSKIETVPSEKFMEHAWGVTNQLATMAYKNGSHSLISYSAIACYVLMTIWIFSMKWSKVKTKGENNTFYCLVVMKYRICPSLIGGGKELFLQCGSLGGFWEVCCQIPSNSMSDSML